MESGRLSTFPVSAGVSWSSTVTCELIIDFLLEASQSHLARLAGPGDNAWMDIVRARPSELALKSTRRVASGFDRYLSRAYEDAVGSRSIRLGGPPLPGDSEVYEALLALELAGHPRAAHRRVQLGHLRFVRRGTGQAWLVQDAIRLVRQGAQRQHLDSLIRYVRANGPLDALVADALQIIEQRLAPPRLRSLELSVLAAAANLLDQKTASRALDGVLGSRDYRAPVRGSTWEAESVRLEPLWRAAGELAGVAGRVDEVARSLLNFAVSLPEGTHGLLDLASARAVDALDWAAVSQETQEQWRHWLAGPKSEQLRELSLRLTEVINPRGPLPGYDAAATVSLEALVWHLNRHLQHEEPVRQGIVEPGTALVLRDMATIRRDAASGSFSGGGAPVCEVAVGLALYAGATSLWPAIADFITDMRVRRDDKTSALERLAREHEKVPAGVAEQLGANARALLDTSAHGFTSEAVSPYPAALRCFSRLNLLPTERVLTECSRLAGAESTLARVEAARTVSSLAGLKPAPPWTVVSALHLSHDQDAGVRAEAGRALALLLDAEPAGRRYLSERLLRLLDEDGVLVPLLILRGLAESELHLGPLLRTKVEGMAYGHVDRGVRLQAKALIGSRAGA